MRILVLSIAIGLIPSTLWAGPPCCAGSEGSQCGCRCCAMSGKDSDDPARAGEPATQPQAGRGMSAEDHTTILVLLGQHKSITRVVAEIPGGVRTTTTTDRPELVATLREHVRQMASRLTEKRPVRMWDPTFRDVFAHADDITLKWKNIEGGIEVTETSEKPEAVAAIRAHAKKVNEFVGRGHAAARPPWARGGRR